MPRVSQIIWLTSHSSRNEHADARLRRHLINVSDRQEPHGRSPRRRRTGTATLGAAFAILCVLALTGCGGSSGESHHDRQVKEAVETIESIDHLNHEIRTELAHFEATAAEFEKPLKREALAHFERTAGPALAHQACEEIPESPFCREVVERGNFQAAAPADPRVVAVEAKLIHLIDRLRRLGRQYEAEGAWSLVKQTSKLQIGDEEGLERESTPSEIEEACEKVGRSSYCGI